MAEVTEQILEVAGWPARVHVGGRGEPLLLIHGGWGGAALHWSRVWSRLAEEFMVLAPELPGIGDLSRRGLGPISAFARWLEELLEVVGARSAWIVGNSFGAAIAWELARHSPQHCRGLVLVDGTPLPPSPRWIARLGEHRLSRPFLLELLRWTTFSTRTERAAFARPTELPPELRAVFRDHHPPQREALLDGMRHGGEPLEPGLKPLIVWGARDRLPFSSTRAARRLHAALPGSELAIIAGAGHLPQLENPRGFLEALLPFLEAHEAARHQGVVVPSPTVSDQRPR